MKIKNFLTIFIGILFLWYFTPLVVQADTPDKIVTFGADLTPEQQAQVAKDFGLDNLDDVFVVYVDNTTEHQYLDGLVPQSTIGSKTYSCSYIEMTDNGYINVVCNNMTYITDDVLRNALQTAGITSCNVAVTAPFPVSGTGAITGIYKAFEASNLELDTGNKEVATEEMVLTAEMEETYGEDVTDFVTELKQVVVEDVKTLTEEELRTQILEKSAEHGINLTEDDIDKLIALLQKIQKFDFKASDFDTTEIIDTFNNIFKNVQNTMEDYSTEKEVNEEELPDTDMTNRGLFFKILDVFNTIRTWINEHSDKMKV